MIYIILGVGVVVVVAVTIMNKSSKMEPAIKAAKKVRDSVHITDDGNQHGSYEGGSSDVQGGDFSTGSIEEKMKKETGEQAQSAADLVWAGKGSRIEISGVTLPGPMTYWANGPSRVKEPCCIDITLPVKFDENIGQPEIPSSYDTMSPEQRGAYLRWLSRGRMGAVSASYFRTWFFGIERRAMVDKKDMPMCLGEISSRLHSLLENPALPVILRFMTCVAVTMKYPTDRLALDLRCVATLPMEILNVLLTPYAGSDIRLPPLIAYTTMRSAFPGNNGPVLHNDEQLMLFTAAYTDRMDMGMTLARPKPVAYVAYFPTNPVLSGPKPLSSIETPDFFKDPSQFAPLLAIWEQVRNMRLNKPTPPPRKKRKLPPKETSENEEGKGESEELPTSLDKEMRSDIDSYISEKMEGQDGTLVLPMLELSELVELEIGEKPTGAQRRGLCEITRKGGRLIVPDLGISGKIYRWEDLVALVWIEIGDRVTDAYRASALLFEFAAAFVVGSIETQERKPSERKKKLTALLEKLTLHFELDKDEQERLEVLSAIFEHQTVDPQSLAGSLQTCIQVDDRQLLRDFFFRLCAPTGDSHAKERDEFLSTLSGLLEVEGRPQPIAKSTPIELGEMMTKALTRLFRSEELPQKDSKEGKNGKEENNE